MKRSRRRQSSGGVASASPRASSTNRLTAAYPRSLRSTQSRFASVPSSSAAAISSSRSRPADSEGSGVSPASPGRPPRPRYRAKAISRSESCAPPASRKRRRACSPPSPALARNSIQQASRKSSDSTASSTSKAGSTPPSTGNSRMIVAAKAWIVEIGARSISARADRSRRSSSSGSVFPSRAASISRRIRAFISPAAFSVKVMATICPQRARPRRSNAMNRSTRSVVLPVPAPASTQQGPSSCSTARRLASASTGVLVMPGLLFRRPCPARGGAADRGRTGPFP